MRASGATALFAATCLTIVATVGDLPVSPGVVTPSEKKTGAAIAIRDNVIPFQKWGTRIFTLQNLESRYAEVFYFTQYSSHDQMDDIRTALSRATQEHKRVDLFLLAHQNRYIDLVAELPEAQRERIGLVYDTGCGDAEQAGAWLALGADAHVGHPGQSLSPIFYVFFLRRWLAGWRLDDAVSDANHKTESRLRLVGLAPIADLDIEQVIMETLAWRQGRDDLRLGHR